MCSHQGSKGQHLDSMLLTEFAKFDCWSRIYQRELRLVRHESDTGIPRFLQVSRVKVAKSQVRHTFVLLAVLQKLNVPWLFPLYCEKAFRSKFLSLCPRVAFTHNLPMDLEQVNLVLLHPSDSLSDVLSHSLSCHVQ